MKRRTNRIPVILPVLLMLLSLFPLSASADGEDWAEAQILEVSNYSHYYQTGQYYEGAFVLWKNNVLINNVPIQTDTGSDYIVNYSDEQLAGMGVQIVWLDSNGQPAVIDYDSPNTHYFGGPARVGQYTVRVTQTLNGETRDISAPVSFTITATAFSRFTDYDNIESGARYYLYSIAGEMDGQLYVMAMPTVEATLRQPAIPVSENENGLIYLGSNRENIFMLKRDAHMVDGHYLYHLTTGTALDIFFNGGGGNGIARGRGGLTGDAGFYIDTDPNNGYAATIYEPNIGHGPFLLAKDGSGSVFFTRGSYSDGSVSPSVGAVAVAPVYLYWNQEPQPIYSGHSYEFLDTPYDKEYDGDPIDFDENKNISVDGGKTSWADLVNAGEARLIWRLWQGKETVEVEGPPYEVGLYMAVIQEPGKEKPGKEGDGTSPDSGKPSDSWIDVCSEGFGITSGHIHQYGEPSWIWRGASAFATFTCSDCTDTPPHSETIAATVDSETSGDGKTVTYTAFVDFNGARYTDVHSEDVTHSVFFVSNLDILSTQTVRHGETAQQPDDPSLENWWFIGWYADEALETPFDFSTPITADTPVYAGWIQPDLSIPAEVTTIGDEAFRGCAFRFALLGEETERIGELAFADCPNLAYIYIPASVTEIDENAFGSLETLTVFGQRTSEAQRFAAWKGWTFRPVSAQDAVGELD